MICDIHSNIAPIYSLFIQLFTKIALTSSPLFDIMMLYLAKIYAKFKINFNRGNFMLKDNPQYKELLNLRSAIIGKQQAQQCINDVTKKKDSLKFTLEPPEKRDKVTLHTDELERVFKSPTIQQSRSAANKKDFAAIRAKKFLFSFLALLFLVVGAICIYFAAVWTWNTSITSMTTKAYMGEMMPYEVAVGIHLFALTIVLAVLAIVTGILAYSDYVPGALYTAMVTSIVLGVVSLIISFVYFYSPVSGFIETVLMFLAAFLYIPKFFSALIFVIVFMLAVVLTVFLVGRMIYLCANAKRKHRSSYKTPTIDMSELYNSKEYREAKEKDALATAEDLKIYKEYYNAAKANHDKKILSHQNAIAQYQRIVSNCTKTIQSSDILHSSQKNLDCINTILCYFELRRAVTVQEAINLYIQDQQMMRIENKLDEIQRATISALKQEVNKLSAKLDQVQTAISNDIATVNKTLKTQTDTINKSIEQLRADNNSNARSLMEIQSQSASTLGHIYTETRLKRLN